MSIEPTKKIYPAPTIKKEEKKGLSQRKKPKSSKKKEKGRIVDIEV